MWWEYLPPQLWDVVSWVGKALVLFFLIVALMHHILADIPEEKEE